MRLWTRIAFCALATTAILLSVVHWRGTRRTTEVGQPFAGVPWRPPGYVGDETCARCHYDVAQNFHRSEMARSWGLVAEAEHIEPPGDVYDPNSQMHYEMSWRDGRLFVREYRLDGDGRETHSLEVEAKYHIGSGNHGRAYATESRGYLTKIPVGWYGDSEKWAMEPGYESGNMRFDRPIIPECVGCHGSLPAFIEGSVNRFRIPLPGPISCERCHGPGDEHVVAHSQGPAVIPAADQADPTIVNPARLAPNLAQDVCLQCHLQGDVMVDQPGSGLAQFRPGLRLREYRSYFFAGEQDPGKPASVGHVPRSQLSRCFTESGGKMTCMSCHDVHRPLDEVPVSSYNNRCLSCHTDRGCTRQLEPGETVTVGNCVSCHMPRVASGDIGHAVTTEHWIRRRPETGPLVDSAVPTPWSPAAGLPRGFFGDEPDGQLGAAVVRTPFLRSDPDRLEQALALLEKTIERRPEMLTCQLDLARGYYHAERFDEAIRILQRLIAADPGSTEACELLGLSYGSIGQADRSIKAYEEALRHNPDFASIDHHLAVLYSEQNRADRLLEMAKQVFSRHPDDARVLGLVARAQYIHAKDAEGALDLLTKAKKLDPMLVQLYMLEAQIAGERGQTKRAEQALRGAIMAQPDSVPAHLQLAIMLVRDRRFDEATTALKRVLELEPENEPARGLIRRLDQ